MKVVPTSAFSGHNVRETFMTLIDQVVKLKAEELTQERYSSHALSGATTSRAVSEALATKKKSCCKS